jgi:hypothetical protein
LEAQLAAHCAGILAAVDRAVRIEKEVFPLAEGLLHGIAVRRD